MGANQSNQQQRPNQDHHGIITVVSQTAGHESKSEPDIVLPPRVPPILSVDGHTIDHNKHKPHVQLDQQLWVDFVTSIDRFSNSRADLVATRQSQLQEKIIQVDEHVQRFTDSYINDKHKALARMNDDCRKVDEMGKLLEKCTIQTELCVAMLNKLNFLLPPEHKLETLEV